MRNDAPTHRAAFLRRRDIAQVIRCGLTAAKAARQFEVSIGVAHNAMVEFGVPAKKRGRKPSAWPECPDHLRAKFRKLCKRMPAEGARARLEDSAHVG